MTDAIYARVSTEDQAKNGYSLSEQLRECRKKSGRKDNLEYVDDGYSGEFLDRPGLAKLRKDLKDGIISRVIVLDPDRLSRKLMNQLLISDEIEKNAELIFVNGEYQKTPEGMLFYQMRGAIAEFEKAKITERMSRGRKEKARQGKVLRDYQIYGYDYDKEREQLIINEYEAKVVQLIFSLFTDPPQHIKGINGIAKFLTQQGIPTKRRAKQWHRQVVRQILMNRTYIGEFYQNRWNTEGMISNRYLQDEDDKIKMKFRPKEDWIKIESPSIISEEQFRLAQGLLQQSKRRWSGKTKHEYLLSGILRCADCNNTMTGRKQKNWGKHTYMYTDRKNTAGVKHNGCGHSINCETLDQHIWDTVKVWLDNPDEIAATTIEEETSTFEIAELNRINEELVQIKNKKDRLLTLLLDEDDLGIEQDIRNKMKVIKIQEEKLKEQKEDLEEILQVDDTRTHSHNIIKDASEYYLSLKDDEIDFDIKKELIRKVIREIRISKENGIDLYTL